MKKVIRNRLSGRYAVFGAKLILDIFLFNLASFVSVVLRFDLTLKAEFLHFDDIPGLVENASFILFELLFNLPRQMWVFTSIKELLDVIFSVTLAKVVALPFYYLMRPSIYWSRGAYLISWIISIGFLSALRIISRVLDEVLKSKSRTLRDRRRKNVLVVGGGDAGEKVIREIRGRPELNYRVVGVLDDDPAKRGMKLHGVAILGGINDIQTFISELGVDIVIYAIPSAPKDVLRRVVSLCSRTGVEIQEVPALWELIGGRVDFADIRKVVLEDLLPRESIKMDIEPVRKLVRGKTVLITGAGGSIGSEIARQVAVLEPGKLILLDRAESRVFEIEREINETKRYEKTIPLVCDIRDRHKMFRVFDEHKPQIVFHSAALKHVPLMEKNPDEAIMNNIFGTKNLLEASIRYKAERFVNISTDKAVNPISMMGVSKRVVEVMLQLYASKHKQPLISSVRFGNVLGSDGSVVEVFKKQISETGVITITDPKMERYFMLIPEAVSLVLQSSAMEDGSGDIYVLKMGEPVNILEFAETFVKLSGFELGKDVRIEVIGNRGNEKLKEELWSEKEEILETNNPYILRIKTQVSIEPDLFFETLSKLEKASKDIDLEQMKKLIKIICPEYRS